jgi:3D-(3,5/4)-trihydroxycyclohexane-1,2-dione acylhydrolase (decyclizing)
MTTIRLTTGQAIVRYLMNQYVELDGESQRFFAGCWGIFGHGNIGGVAQGLQQAGPDFPYYLARNEQSMVHTAIGFAKMSNRRRAFACLTSIGPGATNMVTGAATATINRIPVLLLTGDTFAERLQDPVLQQLSSEHDGTLSASDAFRPVVRYFDRISRPEQLIAALPEVMRTLTSPADTGAVCLTIPQDVQTFAFDFPEAMFQRRTWVIPRQRPDETLVARAAAWIREAQRPMIIAGGGVRYSEATQTLRGFAERHGIPVGETQAGKGALDHDHPLSLGGAGVAGTRGANLVAEQADLIIGVGTRYTDFITASKTAFQNEGVRFININVFEHDAVKHAAIPLTGDAKVAIAELDDLLGDHTTSAGYQAEVLLHNREWDAEIERLHNLGLSPISQGEIIGIVEAAGQPGDVVVTAAGSLPGDLLKMWRCREYLEYQLEYGNSVMGYEVPGGIGAALAAPDRHVTVMVGDGSFLMQPVDIAVAVQEAVHMTIVLIDNHGFSSVGRVSEQVGSEGFGCHYQARGASGWYDGPPLDIDFPGLCRGLGAHVTSVATPDELRAALADARQGSGVMVVYVKTDWHERVPGYASCWWDMATAQVSTMPAVQQARKDYEEEKVRQRYLMVEGAPHVTVTQP